ncbi:hypothetical protein PM082_011405 [Marasmius tenuissimus]|nr:hypothetical protein PM082_011405 [Marasmius tenuissimus]
MAVDTSPNLFDVISDPAINFRVERDSEHSDSGEDIPTRSWHEEGMGIQRKPKRLNKAPKMK